MQLSNIIGRAISLNTVMGVTYQKKAVAAAVDLLRSDEEATDEARYVAASRMIHDQATQAMRRIAKDNGQGSFFELRERYALDIDARVFKDTERLSELEFDRIIAIREKQLEDDAAHLNRLKEAKRELAPIWREHPDKLFGEVEAIYLRRRGNGNGHGKAA
ncbi:MAG TPA: hypothetical protein VL614_21520 [Acetobacteraceae bacterium]|jgi:hypothetical protein|nr:hypothetical protein [Acetobacteraceae bacterium]